MRRRALIAGVGMATAVSATALQEAEPGLQVALSFSTW